MSLNWKKYNEIENSYRDKYIDQIKMEGLNGGVWTVTEKIDGQNLSFVTNGETVRMAKRTCLIADNENFGGVSFYKDKYIPIVKEIFKVCKDVFGDINSIIVYGEDYGGSYPHPDVPRNTKAKSIQGRVFYRPDNDFIAYDLVVNNKDGSYFYVDIHKAYAIFRDTGMPFIPILFEGAFHDCLNYQNQFNSTVPTMLGLPDIENNICEGVVIKPENYKTFGNGDRVIIKNKNDKFSETKNQKVREPLPDLSEAATLVQEHINKFVTENRLRNVISHIGVITQKDFGLLMKEMSIDVMKDYNKEYEGEMDTLESNESKRIGKWFNKEVSQLIRENFLNIIDETF
jgi:Rnl2 family RNA ligase